uniref:Uncharacterized protein n=1 Tax=Alexandrium andersonii TaxID=327968 RepID=A0A7S2CAL9_9DINO
MSDIMKQPVPPPAPPRHPGPNSLNRDARKKELLRITKDNQTILRRIQQAQPEYNHIEWKESHRRNTGYLKNCAEYPLALRSARGRPSELVPLRGAAEEQRPQSAREHRPQSGRSSGRPAGGGDSMDAPAAGELAYVLKEGKLINGSYYLIEMATDGQTLNITAYDGETRTNLELVLKEPEFRRLYREARGDYSTIAQQLAVEGGRLVLVEAGAPPASAPAAAAPPSAAERCSTPDEMDVEAMVVYKAKTGSAGSVNAEINLGSSGDPQVRFRGLTPSSVATTSHAPRTPGNRSVATDGTSGTAYRG